VKEMLPNSFVPEDAKCLLRVEQLSWSVGDKKILQELNFFIQPGEFVGVIGPNGSGKSSLLRCLYRKNQPTAGDIYFQQQPIQQFSKNDFAKKVAVVLQEPPTEFQLSTADVIRMGLTPYKSLLAFDTLDDEKKIRRAAQQVDLLDKLNLSFNELSGGEKQRAMIARAILQSPELLIMDEPTNHLDIRHQIDILTLAKSMGITILVSIHDLNLAAHYCDRLILLNQGRIVTQGKPEAVLTEKRIQSVFEVDANIALNQANQKLQISYNFFENEVQKNTLDKNKTNNNRIENALNGEVQC
jgi:iron complex transport system ATP-binding protein